MISAKPELTPEAQQHRLALLEQSINKIEAEFNPALRQASPGQGGQNTQVAQTAPLVARPPLQPDPGKSPQGKNNVPLVESTVQPAQQSTEKAGGTPPDIRHVDPIDPIVEIENEEGARPPSIDLAAKYRAKRNTIRFAGIIGMLLILALVAWVGYLLITSLVGGISGDPSKKQVQRVSPLNPVDQNADNGFQYITIVEADDPSAIITNGRGTVSIVQEQNQNILRIMSIRSASNKTKPAEPMLLELKPGVLQQIIGKRVTVEILAKSGNSGPATFSVECDLGELGSCGRKRFRVGLQPEAVVFSIDLKNSSNFEGPAYLAINTDIASSANLSGQGDVLDIVSARLRIVGDN